MFVRCVISFVLCVVPLVCSYSAFECQGSWNSTYEDSRQTMDMFQKWLYAWQHSCSKGQHKAIATNNLPFASSIQSAVHGFITAIEMNNIFRPDTRGIAKWHWSEEDASRCTLGLQSVECYSRPLTCCDRDCETDLIRLINPSDLINFSNDGMDSCGMAQKTHKSLQWIQGQFLHYILRPKADIHWDIKSKFDQVYGDLPRPKHLHHSVSHAISKPIEGTSSTVPTAIVDTSATINNDTSMPHNYSTIGVFVRGGMQNAGRKMYPLSAYMKYVDVKAAELAAAGRPVAFVYVCSDRPEEMGINAEKIQQLFPNRSYTFKVLPHLPMDFDYEIPEFMADKWKSHSVDPPNRRIYVEYLTDFEILASMDVFISAYSSVYGLVTALRIARHSDTLPRNSSCFLDNHVFQDPPLYCEGVHWQTRELWKSYFGGYGIESAFV